MINVCFHVDLVTMPGDLEWVTYKGFIDLHVKCFFFLFFYPDVKLVINKGRDKVFSTLTTSHREIYKAMTD